MPAPPLAMLPPPEDSVYERLGIPQAVHAGFSDDVGILQRHDGTVQAGEWEALNAEACTTATSMSIPSTMPHPSTLPTIEEQTPSDPPRSSGTARFRPK